MTGRTIRIIILINVVTWVVIAPAALARAQTGNRGVKRVPHRITLANGKSFTLNLPVGFGISVAAQGLKRVRLMAKSPDDRIFVTDMYNLADNTKGTVYILDEFNPASESFKKVTAYLQGLRNPNSIAFYQDQKGVDYVALPVSAQEKPRVAEIDRVRLAEAFRIGDALGKRIWPGWNKVPFAVLLVTPEYEFLIRHPKPSADFKLINHDPLLKSNVYYRKRTQPQNLLATFPIVGGIPTVVIGQAENTTKKTSTPWVVTMLHEHFHQLQYSQPRYYEDVSTLGLTRGDKTGMWMLNYPFPYEWLEMKELFSHLSHALADALQAKTKSDFSVKLAAYLKQRHELENILSPDDYRYFSFQLWQEGVARYTEYRVAKLAAGGYRPGKAFRSLKDYRPFDDVAEEIRHGILHDLTTGKLEDYKRVIFYALGAGEALLLDRVNPRWQRQYFVDKFYLDKYLELRHTQT